MERPAPWVPPSPLPLPLYARRLSVDVYREEDAPALFRAIEGHRTALARWLPWVRTDHATEAVTLDRIRTFATAQAAAHPEDFVLGIFDADRREVLGGTGFHRIEAETATADVGYWIRPDHQGQGLCTEAVAALITSGFQSWGFRRVTVGCDGENRPSQRVAEKLGLRLETWAVKSLWEDEWGWRDRMLYAVLAEEWDADAQRGPTGR